MKNKNKTVGTMFGEVISEKLSEYVKNIEGIIKNGSSEGGIVGIVPKINIPILINYKNIQEIIAKHGMLDINGLILTINEPDRIITAIGKSNKEMLNFIKFSKAGFQIAAAIRINGFAVITHFERCIGGAQMTRRTQRYLGSLLNRGSMLHSSGKTADLPLITDVTQYPPSEP